MITLDYDERDSAGRLQSDWSPSMIWFVNNMCILGEPRLVVKLVQTKVTQDCFRSLCLMWELDTLFSLSVVPAQPQIFYHRAALCGVGGRGHHWRRMWAPLCCLWSVVSWGEKE